MRLGIVGWVRNLPDGDVELLAEGDASALADFREWLEEGPPGSVVSRVVAENRPPAGHFSGFSAE